MNEQLAILIFRLKEGELSTQRFLKVGEDKAAFEPAWQNRLYTPEEMEACFQDSGWDRWGICGKDNLVLMDSDKIGMYEALSKVLPDTFEVTSPRRGIPAKYLIVCGEQVPNKTLHLKGEEEGAGEVRADNEYLVTCGTEITFKDLVTGEQRTGVYKITKNAPFARMEYDDFMKAVLPFLGKDSTQKITFEQMRKGVASGTRHAQGIKYATFLVGVQKFDGVTTLHAMQEWNKLNQPPMNDSDLIRMVENASGYIAANTPAEPTLPPDTEKAIELEVQKVMDADNQLDALGPHLDDMIVGEPHVKKAAMILLLSGKTSNPKMKQIILFKSTEGAGKSYMATALTRGYKTKYVGRFSEHALDYTDLQGYDVLFLKELGLMDEEKQGVSTLKFLSSDDLGYTIEITVKNEDGTGFTTEQRRIPPITVVSTTTRLLMDKQFERRAFPFGLDETSEQTEAIADWAAKNELQESEKLLGSRMSTSQEISTAVYSRFIERFEPKNIIVPFPKTLLQVLGTKVLRVRGDMNKLLTFMKLYGQLNTKRLESAGKDNLYILSPEVALEALNIILEPLSDMLSRIDKRTKQFFDGLKEIVDIVHVKVLEVETEKLIKYDVKGSEIDKKLRDRIAVKIDKSESTIRRFLNQLESSGYVSGDGKKPKTFTLLYDVSEIETKVRGISDKIKSHDSLITEMEKEAREWRGRLSCNTFLGDTNNTSTFAESIRQDPSADSAQPPSPKIVMHDTSLPPSQTALAERTLDNRAIQKLPIIREENMKECPLCLKPLPDGGFDTTYYQGKLAHCVCVARLKSQEAQP